MNFAGPVWSPREGQVRSQGGYFLEHRGTVECGHCDSMSDYMSKAKGSWQLLATWLLCAFIMASYLDKLPDPPAVGPHGNEAKAACLNGHGEGSVDQDRRWAPRSLPPALVVVCWLDSRKVFSSAPPVPCPTQMRLASDSSPPNPTC